MPRNGYVLLPGARSARRLRVLSLGAGKQSSTLLLMAYEGELELDAAIFADPGWESQATYAWLDQLEGYAADAGIPFYRVSNGNIRTDTNAAGRRSAALPAFLKQVTPAQPSRWCEDHNCLNSYPSLDGQDVQEALLSGTDEGGAPLPEPVRHWHAAQPERVQAGMGRRQCTNEYKITPIRQKLRALGATRRQPVDLLLGISLDEIQRMRTSDVQYIRNVYPLVDLRMTRGDCETWLAKHGYPNPQKSACIGCPFRRDAEWRALTPAEFADAVAFDHALRRSRDGMRADQYLHRSLVPLEMVDLSTEQDHGQTEMDFDGCGTLCAADGVTV